MVDLSGELKGEMDNDFRNFIEQLNEGVLIIQDGLIKYANESFTILTGCPISEIKNTSFEKYLHPDEVSKVLERYHRRKRGDNTESRYETIIRHRKKGYIPVEVSVTPTFYQGGRAEIIMFRDISHHKKIEQALKDREELWRAVTENSPDYIILLDKNARIQFINRTMGFFEAETMYGKSIYEYVSPKFHKMMKECYDKVLQEGIQCQYEVDYTSPDGKKLTFEGHVGPLWRGGKIEGIVLRATDITQRKIFEKALMESERKYRLVVENANEIISIIQDGKIIYTNPASSEVLGYSVSELIGKSFIDIVHPEDRDVVLREYSNTLKGERDETITTINRLIHKSGDIKWVESRAETVEWDKETAVLIFSTDVTDRKIAEEKLRESEQRYRILFESSPEGIAILGMDGTVLDCNNVVVNFVGLSKSKIIGKKLSEIGLFPEEKVKKFEWMFSVPTDKPILQKQKSEDDDSKASKAPRSKSESEQRSEHRKEKESKPKHKPEYALSLEENIKPFEVDMVTSDERKYWFEVFPGYLKMDGKPYAIQFIIRDITERKVAEEKMRLQLMKFDLKEGNIYLVKEHVPSISVEALNDLFNVGFHGTVISRTLEKELNLEGNYDFYWLGDIPNENSLKDISDIEKVTGTLARNEVVFLDRLDYIIMKNGFHKTLSFIQRLKDRAYYYGFIVIISLDPDMASKHKLMLLEKETSELGIKQRVNLSEEMMELLKFVYRQNNMGIKPTYTEIRKLLGISKPTVKKRVEFLTGKGFLTTRTKGRSKVIELTEKGWRVFLE